MLETDVQRRVFHLADGLHVAVEMAGGGCGKEVQHYCIADPELHSAPILQVTGELNVFLLPSALYCVSMQPSLHYGDITPLVPISPLEEV